MNCDNHYTHCGTDWTVEDCDSFHNDKCPKCGDEICPTRSTEYTSGGAQEHYHVDITSNITIENVNIGMLRRQRNTLLELTASEVQHGLNPEEMENLEGLVSLCDIMLDIAEGFGGKL